MDQNIKPLESVSSGSRKTNHSPQDCFSSDVWTQLQLQVSAAKVKDLIRSAESLKWNVFKSGECFTSCLFCSLFTLYMSVFWWFFLFPPYLKITRVQKHKLDLKSFDQKINRKESQRNADTPELTLVLLYHQRETLWAELTTN